MKDKIVKLKPKNLHIKRLVSTITTHADDILHMGFKPISQSYLDKIHEASKRGGYFIKLSNGSKLRFVKGLKGAMGIFQRSASIGMHIYGVGWVYR